MIDKEKLKKAQEWADQASEMAKYSPTMPERAKAAAEAIKSLPDTIVDGKKLRNVIDRHVFDMEGDLLDDLEALLPAPPAPRTMAEIEWDGAEHHLAEATVSEVSGRLHEKVLMLGIDDFGNIRSLDPTTREMWSLSPDRLTPTGRKYLLVPETTEQDDAEQVIDPAYTYHDRHGDVWRYEEEEWWCYQNHYRTFRANGTPPAEYAPYTRIKKEKNDE